MDRGFSLTSYPDRPTWLEARRFSIGSSDAAGLMGESRWSSPVQLNYLKRGLIPTQEPDPERADALDWHREREGEIARWWWERQLRGDLAPDDPAVDDWMSFVTRPTVGVPLALREAGGVAIFDPGDFAIAHRVVDGVPLSATLDRGLWRKAVEGVLPQSPRDAGAMLPERLARFFAAPVELKNAAEWMRSHWLVSEPPLVYQLQVQHQMLVTESRYAYLVASIGGQPPVWAEIRADGKVQDILLRCYRRFWDSVVGNYDLPADYSEVTARAVAVRYPQDDGSTIALGAEADAWWRSRVDALAAISELEKTKEAASNNLKQALGEATYGRLPSGITVKLAADKSGKRNTLREYKEREAA